MSDTELRAECNRLLSEHTDIEGQAVVQICLRPGDVMFLLDRMESGENRARIYKQQVDELQKQRESFAAEMSQECKRLREALDNPESLSAALRALVARREGQSREDLAARMAEMYQEWGPVCLYWAEEAVEQAEQRYQEAIAKQEEMFAYAARQHEEIKYLENGADVMLAAEEKRKASTTELAAAYSRLLSAWHITQQRLKPIQDWLNSRPDIQNAPDDFRVGLGAITGDLTMGDLRGLVEVAERPATEGS